MEWSKMPNGLGIKRVRVIFLKPFFLLSKPSQKICAHFLKEVVVVSYLLHDFYPRLCNRVEILRLNDLSRYRLFLCV